MAGSTIELTAANWESEVVKSDLPILVDFWAAWCGPCRVMAPVMDELATRYAGVIKVGKLNVDEYPEIAGRFGVMSIPTFIYFKNGEPVHAIVGVTSIDRLVQELGL